MAYPLKFWRFQLFLIKKKEGLKKKINKVKEKNNLNKLLNNKTIFQKYYYI
jgi:hypothetical protein